MASIATTVEIARSPEDVFAYITDVSRHREWQEGLVSATLEGEGPLGVGSRLVQRRKLGPTTVAVTSEITAFNSPELVSFKGLDGPIRADGSQLPLARRQATRQVAESHENLKRILETAG